MSAHPAGTWLRPAGDARSRPAVVVHFTHAGGSAVSYRSWARLYPPDVGFISVEPPGRGQRSAEPPATSIDAAAHEVAQELRAWPAHRVILFGHSMGALLAFEVARSAPSCGWQPAALVVSGSRAPSEDLGRPRITHLAQPAFGARAVELGLAPAAVVADPELSAMFLEPLRTDLALCEGYPWGRLARLDVPMTVLCGMADHLVPLSSAQAWQRQSARPVATTVFRGGHMFVTEHPGEVVAAISAVMSDHSSAAPATARPSRKELA
jgi:surfactin synthase thioesterase subunit